jgi:MFS family permease
VLDAGPFNVLEQMLASWIHDPGNDADSVVVQINSFYGQSQFKQRFGEFDADIGEKLITPEWQSGLSNSALVGQLAGLVVNAYAQDRFGARKTMMFFMVWMAITIFIPVFAPSLSVLAWGESMCGISWGVFQVRVPTRPRRSSSNSWALLKLTCFDLHRRCQQLTHLRSFPPSFVRTSPPTSACAGAPASYCHPEWSEP